GPGPRAVESNLRDRDVRPVMRTVVLLPRGCRRKPPELSPHPKSGARSPATLRPAAARQAPHSRPRVALRAEVDGLPLGYDPRAARPPDRQTKSAAQCHGDARSSPHSLADPSHVCVWPGSQSGRTRGRGTPPRRGRGMNPRVLHVTTVPVTL